MNDLERRVRTAIKECYDVVIAPTYGLGSALAAVFMKIHGRVPHRATFRTDYYAVDLPEGREWSDAESKGKIKSISGSKSIDYWATQHNLLKLFPDAGDCKKCKHELDSIVKAAVKEAMQCE